MSPTNTSDTQQAALGDSDQIIPRSQWSKHLRRGFKAKAKRLADKVRDEHGFAPRQPFRPELVAARLDIDYAMLEAMGGLSDRSLRRLTVEDPSAFSAVLVRHDDARMIIVNGAHSPERQRSSGGHEVSHVILDHVDPPLFSDEGCRKHDTIVEAEADYLSSVLLVPEADVMWFARTGTSIEAAAQQMGVSVQMMRWRFNAEGAQRRVQRSRSRWR